MAGVTGGDGSPITQLPGGITVPLSTGAPGGPGPGDAMPDTGLSVDVVKPFESVQKNLAPRRAGVGFDDSGQPGQSTAGFSGQTLTSTGAGKGSVHMPHPNSMARPS